MTPRLKDALLKCKENPDTRWGICKNVYDNIRASVEDCELRALALHECAHELDELMKQWPERAQSKNYRSYQAEYPVEGCYRIYDAYQAMERLWDNPRRHALLDWLLEQ